MKTFSKSMRLVCLLLVLMMVVSCFAGCKKPSSRTSEYGSGGEAGFMSGLLGGGNKDKGEDGKGQSQSGGSGNVSAGATDKNSLTAPRTYADNEVVKKTGFSVNTKNFPIVSDGKLTLKVMYPQLWTRDVKNTGAAKAIEELTGIKIEWAPFSAYEIEGIIPSMIQSGNVPDIFFATNIGVNAKMVLEAGKEGIFADLTDYIDKWAPNISKALNADPVIKYLTYSENGRLYCTPNEINVDGTGKKVEFQSNGSYSYIVNKEWLDELGYTLKDLKTTEGFYEVVKAFTLEDPDGNGKNDTYGLGYNYFSPEMFNAWGLGMGWYSPQVISQKGKVEAGALTENFRNGIRYFNRIWSEGLWNADMMNNVTKAQIQKTGIIRWQDIAGKVADSELDKWVAVGEPKAPASECGDYPPGRMTNKIYVDGTPYGMFYSPDSKSIEACLRLVDYFYTPEGSMLFQYGLPGESYTVINGKYKLGKNTLELQKKYGINETVPVVQYPSLIMDRNKADLTLVEQYGQRLYDEKEAMYDESQVGMYYSENIEYFYTAEEQATINKMTNYLGNCGWGYDAIRGVNGANVESGWNTYLSQFTSYEAWQRIAQAAFNRWKALL